VRREGNAAMIIDASAIVAILRNEPEAGSCAHAIAGTTIRRVSAVNYLEAAAVIDGSPRENPLFLRARTLGARI